MHKSFIAQLIVIASLLGAFAPCAHAQRVPTDHIVIDRTRVLNTFTPADALGAGVDGHEHGDNDAIYSPTSVAAMKSAGFGALTYRLRTELGVETWHWNPVGTWSDANSRCGYWTSSGSSPRLAPVSNGYRLPRRGNTIDQANDDSYSRIDDGDPATFWKSNPYLDKHFTGDDNTRHPQWVIIDFGHPVLVNEIRIAWDAPYATAFSVAAWSKGEDARLEGIADTMIDGTWSTVANVAAGSRPVSRVPFPLVKTRFVRVTLTQSSGDGRPARDPRDTVGYAIREMQVGYAAAGRPFADAIRHGKACASQTVVMTSSTDPWHTVADLDLSIEQPSFDRVYASGLTQGAPMLVPVAVLYDTPDNAAAELRYLRSRRLPVTEIELGEEPDGQLCSPEDYGALFIQFADSLKAVDPTVKLGGPSFQTNLQGWPYWPDTHGEKSWMKRFLGYLREHGRASDFAFFSFEWYPFDNICGDSAQQLTEQPSWLTDSLSACGVPSSIPIYMAEYGYSAYAGQPEVELSGALMNTDIALSFLALGGKRAYYYGYEPADLITELKACPTYGNLALFIQGDDNRIAYSLATYQAARLVTRQWVTPGTLPHSVVATSVVGADGQPDDQVSGYSVIRPDTALSVILINKDPHRARIINVAGQLSGEIDEFQYSAKQYVWHAAKDHGYPNPNLLPEHARLEHGDAILLPPSSLTLLREITR